MKQDLYAAKAKFKGDPVKKVTLFGLTFSRYEKLESDLPQKVTLRSPEEYFPIV